MDSPNWGYWCHAWPIEVQHIEDTIAERFGPEVWEDKAEAVQLTAYRTGAKRTRTLLFHDEVEERYYQPAKPGDVIQTIGCVLCQGTPIVAACISCAKGCCAECVEEVTGQCWACLDYSEKQVKRTTKQ